jgi:hypothetical protein
MTDAPLQSAVGDRPPEVIDRGGHQDRGGGGNAPLQASIAAVAGMTTAGVVAAKRWGGVGYGEDRGRLWRRR